MSRRIALLLSICVPLSSCALLDLPVDNPDYKPPAWAIGTWGDSSSGDVWYEITAKEFTAYYYDGAVSWVSRMTTLDQPVQSSLNDEKTVWTLVFGEGDTAVTFVVTQMDPGIQINNTLWDRLD
jgi:hypothetical protein